MTQKTGCFGLGKQLLYQQWPVVVQRKTKNCRCCHDRVVSLCFDYVHRDDVVFVDGGVCGDFLLDLDGPDHGHGVALGRDLCDETFGGGGVFFCHLPDGCVHDSLDDAVLFLSLEHSLRLGCI